MINKINDDLLSYILRNESKEILVFVKLINKSLFNLDYRYYYVYKSNIIKNFFKKYIYDKYHDLKFSRQGRLCNIYSILNNPKKYKNFRIQFISKFQYNLNYIERGTIIEGYIYKNRLNNAWLIYDKKLKKSHPLLLPFIFRKSIRIIT